MFSHFTSLLRGVLLTLVFFSLSSQVSAGTTQEPTSLTGNSSVYRVYFDVNVGIPKKLETRLRLINATYDQLLEQGKKPEFVVGFRGKASYFVTKGEGYVEPEDLAFKQKIQQWVNTIKGRGIRIEQCRIAAGLVGVDPKDFLPELEVVENAYVSMIVYQQQGFSQIPMD